MEVQLVYYSAIILSAVFAGLAQKYKKIKNGKTHLNKFFWYISLGILLLLFGFRTAGVGVDDLSYQRTFINVSKIGPINQFLNTTMELGYLILNYIISWFTDDFQVMIFVTTLIPLILYYKTFEYERDHINLFWAIFFFGMLLCLYFCGITRLFIASSIIAYSLRYVFEKKNVKFILCALLAISFHYSAFIMLFLLYFSTEKEGKERSNKGLIILLVVVLPIILQITSSYILPNMGDRYNHYETVTNASISIATFDKAPLLLVAVILQKMLQRENKNARIYIAIYAFATIVSIYSVMLDIGRVQWYCNIAMCILIPSIYKAIKQSKSRELAYIYMPLMVIYAFIYASAMLSSTTREGMLCYSNILF